MAHRCLLSFALLACGLACAFAVPGCTVDQTDPNYRLLYSGGCTSCFCYEICSASNCTAPNLGTGGAGLSNCQCYNAGTSVSGLPPNSMSVMSMSQTKPYNSSCTRLGQTVVASSQSGAGYTKRFYGQVYFCSSYDATRTCTLGSGTTPTVTCTGGSSSSASSSSSSSSSCGTSVTASASASSSGSSSSASSSSSSSSVACGSTSTKKKSNHLLLVLLLLLLLVGIPCCLFLVLLRGTNVDCTLVLCGDLPPPPAPEQGDNTDAEAPQKPALYDWAALPEALAELPSVLCAASGAKAVKLDSGSPLFVRRGVAPPPRKDTASPSAHLRAVAADAKLLSGGASLAFAAVRFSFGPGGRTKADELRTQLGDEGTLQGIEAKLLDLAPVAAAALAMRDEPKGDAPAVTERLALLTGLVKTALTSSAEDQVPELPGWLQFSDPTADKSDKTRADEIMGQANAST